MTCVWLSNREEADTLGDRLGEMVALGVEATGDGLYVGEPGPVLDVQHRPALQIPSDHVGSTGELIVLVRFVDTDTKPTSVQVGDFDLTHRCMDEVGVLAGGATSTRIHDLDTEFESEAPRDPDV